MPDRFSDIRAASSMALANISIAIGMAASAVLYLMMPSYDAGAFLAVSSAGAYAALFALTWLLSPRGHRASWLGLGRLSVRDAVSGSAVMLLAYPLMIAVAALSAALVPSSTLSIGESTAMAMASMPAWTRALAFAALPAFGEEALCRGMVYSAARRYGRAWGILLPAACFSAMHGNVQQAAYAFLCGLLLSFLRDASSSLWPCVAAHFAFNAVSAIPAGGSPAVPLFLVLGSPVLLGGSVVLVRAMYRRNFADVPGEGVPAGSPVLFSAMLGLGTLIAVLSGRLL